MARLAVLLVTCVAALVACEAAVVVTGRSANRTCYKCYGCVEWWQKGRPDKCASYQHSCYKLVLGTHVERGCSTCSVRDLEKGFPGVFSSFTSSRATEDPGARVAHCCEHDFCNGGGAVSSAPALCAAALAALMARPAL